MVFAEPPTLQEYHVKAAFLYNFPNFIQWPEEVFSNKTSPIVLGILGRDPFGEALEAAEGKTVSGRNLTIRRFNKIEDLEFSHILFISESEVKDMSEILEALNFSGVLTVGDTDGFAQSGGIINFIQKDNKIRFEINVSAADAAGLSISSKLLNLANIIDTNKSESDN